ncbi:MAG: M13 family metallopeptidase [Candidatus Pacebacteria bacterium]|nr:M13 family metallopeptidase [Candidatus Paceibacterota bacterium]
MKKDWGFDARDIDTKVRPQDDFYHYANGGWLAKNPIPPHESRWGSFVMLRYDTEKKLRTLVTKVEKMKKIAVGSPEQFVRDYYRSGLDMQKRNALGMKPLQPWLSRIEKIRDVSSLVTTLAHLEKIGGGGPWGLGVDQDNKDSTRYIVYLHQSGLGLPDRDYYLKDDAESKRVRAAYQMHLEAIFVLTGKTKKEAEKDRETILRIETELAKISMTKEDLRDVDKTYHKMRLPALARLVKNVDWHSYFKIVGAKDVKEVVVMQPVFLKTVSNMLASISIEDWKTYLTWHLVGGSASYLSAKFEKQNFAFYGTVLSGVKVMKPLWRRALSATNGALGEALGKLYVLEYFGPEAKKRIVQVVADLFEAYENRIKNLDWMSAGTKKKAIVKLRQMTRKLGYPDTWKSYKGLIIKPDDYFGNAIRTIELEHKRVMRRLKKPVDRKEWFMSPQTVNAYCSFGLNDVVFPAAILQPPFFSKDADDALNYGGIGAVIGHEITHGFDDQGAKFDGKGNRKTWWTKEDQKRFDAKAKVLVKQFNEYKVAGGLKVNGQLTLGENIADLGGASIAFDAYQLRLAKTGRRDIGGFTPEQRFFLGFGLFERENRRPEAEKSQVLTDPHSPGQFRINGPASNLPEFYEAFNVKKGDKLYRPPASRAKIW